MFLSAIGDFFRDFWNSIVDFFKVNGQSILNRTIIALIVLVIGHYLIKLIIRILRRPLKVTNKHIDKSARSFFINFVAIALRLCLAFGVLSILKIKLDGIVSILSAGILAIGLSLQDAIGNFASGIMLLSTKPFKTDDYIEIVGNTSGTVVDIHMMTVILDTPNNQKVVIPNSQVMSSTIINYSAHPCRRLDISIGIDYSSDLKKAKKIALDVLKKDKRILSVPEPMTMIKGVEASSITLGIRGYTKTSDYWETLWSINEELLEAFRKNDIVIPFNKLDVSLVKPKELEKMIDTNSNQ